MKKTYKDRSIAYYPRLEEQKQERQFIILWGRDENRVYLTPKQAINFIKISKESDIN
jgi:hypothetical protein